jgi:hypothetical protein
MRSEEIRAVEMTRRIRDEMYEETKDLSEDELIRFFHERAEAVRGSRAREMSRTEQRRARG